MGIYVKFTMTTHQIWSRLVILASNSENCYFLPNSILNVRRSYQIWGKVAEEQKVTGKKQIGGWKTPRPSAYRVKTETSVFGPLPIAERSPTETLILRMKHIFKCIV